MSGAADIAKGLSAWQQRALLAVAKHTSVPPTHWGTRWTAAMSSAFRALQRKGLVGRHPPADEWESERWFILSLGREVCEHIAERAS